MRAAMSCREREDLALDQAAAHEPLPVAGEAAAELAERAQRQQLALDVDAVPAVAEPVPERLPAVRGLEPLWGVERTLAADQIDRDARGTPTPSSRGETSTNAQNGSTRCCRPTRTTT